LDWPEGSFKCLAYAYVSFVKKTWVGLKGLMNIMFILVGVGLNGFFECQASTCVPSFKVSGKVERSYEDHATVNLRSLVSL
jgi:hypothetical protein